MCRPPMAQILLYPLVANTLITVATTISKSTSQTSLLNRTFQLQLKIAASGVLKNENWHLCNLLRCVVFKFDFLQIRWGAFNRDTNWLYQIWIINQSTRLNISFLVQKRSGPMLWERSQNKFTHKFMRMAWIKSSLTKTTHKPPYGFFITVLYSWFDMHELRSKHAGSDKWWFI